VNQLPVEIEMKQTCLYQDNATTKEGYKFKGMVIKNLHLNQTTVPNRIFGVTAKFSGKEVNDVYFQEETV